MYIMETYCICFWLWVEFPIIIPVTNRPLQGDGGVNTLSSLLFPLPLGDFYKRGFLKGTWPQWNTILVPLMQSNAAHSVIILHISPQSSHFPEQWDGFKAMGYVFYVRKCPLTNKPSFSVQTFVVWGLEPIETRLSNLM